MYSSILRPKPTTMTAIPGASKPFRSLQPKRVVVDHFIEPEFTIPTEDNFTNELDDQICALRYDPRVHVEGVKQWVNKTRPIRYPFNANLVGDGAAADIALSDSLPVHCESTLSVSAADTDSLEEKWRQREFERVYTQLTHQYELQHPKSNKVEARKINEKVTRYKRAFLKGFYEARIRRIETNKWLYKRLHVNAEHIKERYQQLMYFSEPQYVAEQTEGEIRTDSAAAAATTAPGTNFSQHGVQKEPAKENDKDDPPKSITEPRTFERSLDDLNDLEAEVAASVYSFTPERDNVLLQDINATPKIRGFGRNMHKKYDPKLRLLHLDNWVSPDIERWMNERKLNEAISDTESELSHHLHHHRHHPHYHTGEEEDKIRAPKEDLKYEEIRGTNELPTWLGPKKLEEQERDLETFRKLSADNGETRSVVKETNEERKAPQAEGEERADDQISEASKTMSETPSKCLLHQLVQSQSKDYYKLWYATHDAYNTTPFIEARLQRLMREIFGRREWAIYCDYLKDKKHDKNKHQAQNSAQL